MNFVENFLWTNTNSNIDAYALALMLSSDPKDELVRSLQESITQTLQNENRNQLSNEQKQILGPLFLGILNEIELALPPEVFQFQKLISENPEELTESNIIQFNVITFLLELIEIDTPQEILQAVLSIIDISITYSDDLFESFYSNELIEVLPPIFSFPSPDIRILISKIYRTLTDIERVTVPVILQCASSFLIQSVYWIADDQSEECKLNCLYFQYHIIIGSNQNLPKEIIFHLSKSLLAQLLNENIDIVSLAAWSIEALIKNYKITLGINEVLSYVFINITEAFDTPAAVSLLHLVIANLRALTEYPPASEYVSLVNWPYLISKIASDESEISYLSSRLVNLLINESPDIINILLSCNILDACMVAIQNQRFKPIESVAFLMKSFWMYGTIEQLKFVVQHPASLGIMPYLLESNSNVGCVHALYESLNRLIQAEPDLLPLLQQIFTQDVVSPLAYSSNEDVSNYGELIMELLQYEI